MRQILHPFLIAGGLALAVLAQSANAQGATSREVVQPLPSPEVQRLNRALMELARRPRSMRTLLEAADASMAVGDLDAALGFYGRAADIEPNNRDVKIGLARVYLRSGRPLEAIPLLNAARTAGASPRETLSDQALAFDLVGDQSSAQAAYARAIELDPQDEESRRRLAISYAISGNEAGFDQLLAPLVERRNPAAIRARAFGLAILGQQERAEGIVNASMPADLARRINPYLAYMPRLTPSQKAAAANLGIFPRAADIGREDPRIARFSREGAAGSRLEPAGEPLGTRVETVSREVAQAAPTPAPATNPAPTQAATATAAQSSAPGPGFDLSRVPDMTRDEPALPAVATSEVNRSQPSAPRQPANVADAFADLGGGELPIEGRSSDAVDLASIEIPREQRAPPEPAPPAHPRRIWVQLATGRDVDALGFDWRRLTRQADGLLDRFEPHVTPWGQANRLLAGPVANDRAARELINALAEKGIDTFSYTSPEGTEIQELD